MSTETVQLLTRGRIAEKLGESISRVTYILASRTHIRPSAWAGNVRLYDNRALAQIRHELHAILAIGTFSHFNCRTIRMGVSFAGNVLFETYNDLPGARWSRRSSSHVA